MLELVVNLVTKTLPPRSNTSLSIINRNEAGRAIDHLKVHKGATKHLKVPNKYVPKERNINKKFENITKRKFVTLIWEFTRNKKQETWDGKMEKKKGYRSKYAKNY